MAKKSTGEVRASDSAAAFASLGGKIPPQALEFEEAVLGAILLDKDAMQNVVEILQPEHFYTEANQRVYSAMQRLNARMAPIDMLTVTEELKKSGELEAVGGRVYIAKLTSRVGAAVNIEYHARIIFQKYLQRSLIHLGGDMITSGYDESKDVEDIMEEAENNLFTLSQGSMKRDVVQVSSTIDEAIEQMKAAAKREDQLSGLASGFHGIDEITLGWQPATMVVIAARPAMGKTAFVLSMARKMAIDHNTPIAMFSLEMSNVELVKRLMTAETEITSEKIKSGRLTVDEWNHFNRSIGRLRNAPIYIDDTPGLSVFDLRSKARVLKKKHDIKCIIIDYLQLMTASAMKPGSRQEEVSMISRSLKGLAKELNIPVIALSQLNRNVEGRTSEKSAIDSKRPQLSDLRESGAIEQDADMVCFIHRPEYYGIKDDGRGNSLIGMAQFIIAKHRSGRVDDVLLRFRAELIRFEEPEAWTALLSSGDEPASSQTFLGGGTKSLIDSGSGMSLGNNTDAVLSQLPGNDLPNLSNSEEVPF